ncbi:MAG: HlyD family secretion protein [Pseudopedobacter saltans]|uniref:HlyD family secretion protein n=1 Tax=Pseudopedobacter saltans TaxID=151895 RepID=A0A2W5EKZ1_9SPHI|nr:MAG: HlyD family secretion protein [Pseudopedobacter saltans]
MENNNNPQEEQAKKKGSKKFAIIFIIILVVGGAFGFYKYKQSLVHTSTEDAQVSSDMSPVIPRVSGYIKEVRVKENQMVHRGDTLVVLDDRDYAVKVEAADAALETAKTNVNVAAAGTQVTQSNVQSSQQNIGTIDAQIKEAEVNVWRTQKDYDRYANLIKDHTITQQQYEQALAAKQSAERQLDVLKAQRAATAKQVSAVASQEHVNKSQTKVATAQIKQAQASLDAAKLDLTYTVVIAQADGQIGKVNLQPGQYVTAGTTLLVIVPSDSKWVIANFKETQLDKMEVGQKATIRVDAYPDEELEGVVTSLSPATGAAQSLLPPDNASGNFVKVVQRVPVRIDFKEKNNAIYKKIRNGMNVEADVHFK